MLITVEPTAALGVRVMQVASRAIVLRQGRRRGTVQIANAEDRPAHDQIVPMLM